ncbi:MAG: hypothetical protein JSV42_17445, partial [Chloroflexota bacterium]
MRKSLLYAISAVLLIALLITACAPAATEAPTEEAPPEAPPTEAPPPPEATEAPEMPEIDCMGAQAGDQLSVMYQWSGAEEEKINAILKPLVDACGL